MFRFDIDDYSPSKIWTKVTDFSFTPKLEGYAIKQPVFSFNKFPNVNKQLGPEMKSTGEVMGIGRNFGEAYAKAQKAANKNLSRKGVVFISVKESDKKYLNELVPNIIDKGFNIVATLGTSKYIEEIGFPVNKVNKVMEGRPHIVDMMVNGDINLVINTTEGKQSILDSASIRRTALEEKIYCTTTLEGGRAVCSVIRNKDLWSVERLQDLHDKISQ